MTFLTSYFTALWALFSDLWLFLIIGFVIAAIVEEFVSKDWLLRYFGKNNLSSLLRAAGAGFLVSACSCGAIALVASLKERGASTATLLTFLLAAPWLGIPMLLVYVAFIGWVNTIALIALSIFIAIIAGLIMGKLERNGTITQGEVYRNGHEGSTSLWKRWYISVPKRAWVLGKDIGFYLLIGIVIAAIPKAFIDPSLISNYLGKDAGLMAVVFALPISVVIEACSEGFAVLSGQLYEQGATLAVVFVMTMVGVATDVTELSVVWGKFGVRTTVIYVAIGTTLTLLAALSLQYFLIR